jgi:hypothetical protein
LQKHAAEASRKGVVGRIGSTIPMVPRTRQNIPAVSHNARVIVRGFFLSQAKGFEGFVLFMFCFLCFAWRVFGVLFVGLVVFCS